MLRPKKQVQKKKRMSHQYRLQTHPTHYIPDEDSDLGSDSSNTQTDSDEETPQGVSITPPTTPTLRTNGMIIKGTTPPNTPPPASPHSLMPLAENNVLSFNNTLLPSPRELRKRKKT